VQPLSFAALETLHEEVTRLGLDARIAGAPLTEHARALVSCARDGLRRQAAAGEPDETAFLDPLDIILATGESPAGRVLRMWDGELRRDPERLVEVFSQVRLPCYCA
jgi:gamma-glutamylcysteine synthetase